MNILKCFACSNVTVTQHCLMLDLSQMYRGTVPLLLKGPLVTFYGGDRMVQAISDGPEVSWSLPILFISSLLFQLLLAVFKQFYSHKISNYVLKLRATLVNNVHNIYSLLTIIMMSVIGCCYVIYHRLTIKHSGQSGALLILCLLTVFVVMLPYSQNYHLRSESGHLIS